MHGCTVCCGCSSSLSLSVSFKLLSFPFGNKLKFWGINGQTPRVAWTICHGIFFSVQGQRLFSTKTFFGRRCSLIRFCPCLVFSPLAERSFSSSRANAFVMYLFVFLNASKKRPLLKLCFGDVQISLDEVRGERMLEKNMRKLNRKERNLI